MSRHPYLVRHVTPGRFFALSVAFAILAAAILLMLANSVGESARDDAPAPPVTPATAGPPVEYEP